MLRTERSSESLNGSLETSVFGVAVEFVEIRKVNLSHHDKCTNAFVVCEIKITYLLTYEESSHGTITNLKAVT